MSKERTEAECNEMHEQLLKDFEQLNGEAEDDGYERISLIPTVTCHKCDGRFTCPYAYDMYNTDGDCLAEK